MLRWVLFSLHLVLGIAAVGAGQAFVLDPSGRSVGTETEWLRNSPFPDYRVPGLFLLVVIGGSNLLAGGLLVRLHRRAALVSLSASVLLVLWLVIQTGIIGFRSWTQLIWWVLFPALAVLSAVHWHRESEQPSTEQPEIE